MLAFALPPLPELIAKQSTSNIRLISQEGKYTYYQKRAGSLYFSTNYKVNELIKGKPGSNYTVFVGSGQKKIAISQNENYHDYFSLRNPEMIYVADYGKLTIRKVGLGIAPKLHLDDTWISYFNPSLRLITFEQTDNPAIQFSIRINNRINPYFIPNVVMGDENTVYYTDIGENGISGLIEYKRSTAQTDIIFRASSPMLKFELCYDHSILYLAQLGINSSDLGSSISQITFPFKEFKKRETFYTSALNDLGHLVCDYSNDSLYFIKNTGTGLLAQFDIAQFNFKTKKISILTELKDTTTLINMDKTLITFEHGAYLIVKGKSDFKNIDALKPKVLNEKDQKIDNNINQTNKDDE